MNDFVDALNLISPESVWVIRGNNYEDIEWLSKDVAKPTKEEIELAIEKVKNNKEKTKYKQLRFLEYPDFREYLDGVVKGDQEQIQKYINACLEVKKKYPKPEEL